MKFYLYYAFGSCNEGDCMRELEEFDTLQDAERRILELEAIASEGECQIIHGTRIMNMLQVLDNGDRKHTMFVVVQQPANMGCRPGYSAIHNAGRDVHTALNTIAQQMVLIEETYGTKKFTIILDY